MEDNKLTVDSAKGLMHEVVKDVSDKYDSKIKELNELIVKTGDDLTKSMTEVNLTTEEEMKDFVIQYIEKQLGDAPAEEDPETMAKFHEDMIISYSSKVSKNDPQTITSNVDLEKVMHNHKRDYSSAVLPTGQIGGVSIPIVGDIATLYDQNTIYGAIPSTFTDQPTVPLTKWDDELDFVKVGTNRTARGSEVYSTTDVELLTFLIDEYTVGAEKNKSQVNDNPAALVDINRKIMRAFEKANEDIAIAALLAATGTKSVNTGVEAGLPLPANIISKMNQAIFSLPSRFLAGAKIYANRELISLLEDQLGANYWGVNILTGVSTYKKLDIIVVDRLDDGKTAGDTSMIIGNLGVSAGWYRRQDLEVIQNNVTRPFTVTVDANFRASVHVYAPDRISLFKSADDA